MALRQADLADALAEQWRLVHPEGTQPVRERIFHPVRRWRFDLAWADHWLAVECEGGIWRGGKGGGRNQTGAHTGGAGYVKDIEKYNEAALAGWRVIRVTGDMIQSGSALTVIERALGLRPSLSAPGSSSSPRPMASWNSRTARRSARSTSSISPRKSGSA